MTTIDLNADLGESFGDYKIGNDQALLQIVSSANIACGFHGGDPDVMNDTIAQAVKNGVRIGAHPGFRDLEGFGRRVIRGDSIQKLAHMILYQIGAFQAMARANDAQMSYVKLHGALSNLAMVEDHYAQGFIQAILRGKIDTPVMAMPMSQVEKVAREANIGIIREAFADRGYLANGMLAPRSEKDAVIHDAKVASDRVLRMVNDNEIIALDGTKLSVQIDSICIHGDHPESLKIAEEIRMNLENAGVKITAHSSISHKG